MATKREKERENFEMYIIKLTDFAPNCVQKGIKGKVKVVNKRECLTIAQYETNTRENSLNNIIQNPRNTHACGEIVSSACT